MTEHGTPTLWIGNKNYSSWSLRPWVAMREAGIAFEEKLVPFHDAAAWNTYRPRSPGGQVPMLEDGAIRVSDSLAIVEYLAETHPSLWPEDRAARAFARSAAAAMHSGFNALRDSCGMNLGVRARLRRMPEAVRRDLDRLAALWTSGLETFGGPFLVGDRFTAADAFFCPVAFRIQTYGLDLPGSEAAAYAARLLDMPAMRDWYAEALAEPFRDPPHDAELTGSCDILEDLRLTLEISA
jgi:glutathione S-transferase